MSYEIAKLPDLDSVGRLANVIVTGGLFGREPVESTMTKILWGLEMGIGPVTAIQGLNVIQGNPSPKGALIAAMIDRHPDYDYKVVHHDARLCRIEWSYKGKPRGVNQFSMEDAKLAGLTRSANYTKFPKAMLFNRCLSAGYKLHAPGLFGGAAVYTPGEIPGSELPEPIEVASKAVPVEQEPLVAKARGKLAEDVAGEAPPRDATPEPEKPKRKRRACSKCREPGHTAKTCKQGEKPSAPQVPDVAEVHRDILTMQELVPHDVAERVRQDLDVADSLEALQEIQRNLKLYLSTSSGEAGPHDGGADQEW